VEPVILVLVLLGVVLLLGIGTLALRAPRSRRGAPPIPPSAPGGAEPRADDSAAPAAGAGDLLVAERPEPVAGRMHRLRARLGRSRSGLGMGLLAILSRDALDDDAWQDLEDVLITSDAGVATAQALVEATRTRARVEGARGAAEVTSILRDELLALLAPERDRALVAERHDDLPAVVLVVGVNGTGKTTTTGKLARILVAEDRDVVLGAADTFRAAAAAQLTTWGERVGVPTVSRDEGADPASVAYDAVAAGVEGECDVVLVDTAGRLHTKAGLMDELGKVRRVIEKVAPVTEALLVLDATTGQNGLAQARVFAEAVDVTGVVLTKLDGTAKGGIVLAIERELGVPVKFVGLGEGPDDLAVFDPRDFVDGLLGGADA
jgi:fused signal recognition particle receptor